MLFVKTVSENLNQTDTTDHVQILMQKKGSRSFSHSYIRQINDFWISSAICFISDIIEFCF